MVEQKWRANKEARSRLSYISHGSSPLISFKRTSSPRREPCHSPSTSKVVSSGISSDQHLLLFSCWFLAGSWIRQTFFGRYPAEMVELIGLLLPDFLTNDNERLRSGLDFIGINSTPVTMPKIAFPRVARRIFPTVFREKRCTNRRAHK